MASNYLDEIPNDDFPIDSQDIDKNVNLAEDEVVLTPPPQPLTPPPNDSEINNLPGPPFNEKIVERLFAHFQNKIKIGKNAKVLFAELMRIYSLEVITRAGEQATKEGSSKITLEHLEKVLPQFLLDFN